MSLPIRETPAYRFNKNPDGCNLVELIAVVIGGNGSEPAEMIVERFGSAKNIACARAEEIARIPGIGLKTANRIIASVSLGRKLIQPDGERFMINSPTDTVNYLRSSLLARTNEMLVVISLDTRNGVIRSDVVSQGSINSAYVRMAEVFKPPILANAASVVLAHNHPTGDPSPSAQDIAITRAACGAGKLLDIEVLDHVIIGDNRHASLKEKGVVFL